MVAMILLAPCLLCDDVSSQEGAVSPQEGAAPPQEGAVSSQEGAEGGSQKRTDTQVKVGDKDPQVVSLQVVQGSVEQFLDREVVIEGVVKTVNFAPEIRDGSTLSSLLLSEGTASMRVLSPAAILYSEGDRLRISGILRRHPPLVGDLEIDARDGSFEVLTASERTFDTWIRPRTESPGALKVETVPTQLSIFGHLSDIASAVIALVATVAIALRFRRFNLALHIAQPVSSRVLIYDRTLRIHIRILSTGSSPVALSKEIYLQVRKQRFPAVAVLRDSEFVAFPILIRDEELEFRFSLPAEPTLPEKSKVYVRMQDAASAKTFKKRLPWLDAGLLFAQISKDASDAAGPATSKAMDTDTFFRVRGSDRFHGSKECIALRRSASDRIETISSSAIPGRNLSPCKRCGGSKSQDTAVAKFHRK